MAYLDKFNLIVGETIMECQRIEHDIKLIYAGMLKGEFEQNLREVKFLPLGNVLIDLENLDNADSSPYFSSNDYALLKDIKNVRNWLVHKVYMEFMYSEGENWNKNLDFCFRKLTDFNARIKNLSNQVEQIRIDVLKKYGRF